MSNNTGTFSDGLITGRLLNRRKERCEACGSMEYCILVIKVTLPEGMKPLGTFVLYKFVSPEVPGERRVNPIKLVGIRCGCYAKAHRQMTHITDKLKKKGKAKR